MKKRKIYFDIDETVLLNNNRDYTNVDPNQRVVDIINTLYDSNKFEITLYTARAMGRSNGDVQKAIAGFYNLTVEQLDKYGVKYHNLVFGKPSYDWFVDDKAYNVNCGECMTVLCRHIERVMDGG